MSFAQQNSRKWSIKSSLFQPNIKALQFCNFSFSWHYTQSDRKNQDISTTSIHVLCKNNNGFNLNTKLLGKHIQKHK